MQQLKHFKFGVKENFTAIFFKSSSTSLLIYKHLDFIDICINMFKNAFLKVTG